MWQMNRALLVIGIMLLTISFLVAAFGQFFGIILPGVLATALSTLATFLISVHFNTKDLNEKHQHEIKKLTEEIIEREQDRVVRELAELAFQKLSIDSAIERINDHVKDNQAAREIIQSVKENEQYQAATKLNNLIDPGDDAILRKLNAHLAQIASAGQKTREILSPYVAQLQQKLSATDRSQDGRLLPKAGDDSEQ